MKIFFITGINFGSDCAGYSWNFCTHATARIFHSNVKGNSKLEVDREHPSGHTVSCKSTT